MVAWALLAAVPGPCSWQRASPAGLAAADTEDVLGSLTPGKYADFVVLSANPQAVDRCAITEIGVCQTRVAGAVTWTAP